MSTKTFVPVLLILVLPCSAVLFEVPGDFPTIAGALYYTGHGDTVLVHPGVYPERLILPGHDFLLVSEFYFTHDSSALYSTVIDASDFADEDTASVLTFVHGNSRATVVSGFTLSGGHGLTLPTDTLHPCPRGGCIYISASHPTILSNIITENEACHFAAVFSQLSHPRLAHNLIHGNCGKVGLIGIMWHSNLDDLPVVEWNDITDNYGCYYPENPHLAGNILWVERCGAVIRFNRFHDYYGNFSMGAYYLYAWGELIGNSFERLTYEHFPGAQDYGAIAEVNRSVVTVRDNIFRDCTVDWGSPLDVRNRPGQVPSVIERNWFENIRSTGLGAAGIEVLQPSGTISENVFIQCVGDGLAAIGLSASASDTAGCPATIERNHFFYNRSLWAGPGVYGSAIALSAHGTTLCTVRQNWFEGNFGPAMSHERLSGPPPVWDCRWNYWGDPTGPYHPTLNPEGRGDTVPDNILFDPWLTEPPTTGTGPSSPFALPPEDWQLEPPYPNPFNATTRIRLTASRPQPFEVMVYNILGRRVRQLWRGVVPKNTPVSVTWDGRDERDQTVATGLYFIVAAPELVGSSHPKTRKVLLLR